MVFKLFCLYLAVTCVTGAPPTDVVPLEKQQPTVIPIISQSEELEANGTYKYSYETANGIKREETSYDKVLPKTRSGLSSNEGGEDGDDNDEIHVQQGSYSYTAPDGTLISVRYIADENGFRPIGDHFPKAPSVVPASPVGRRAKTIAQDNAVVETAPAPAVATKPAGTEASETSKTLKTPETRKAPAAPKAPEVPQTPEKLKNPEVSKESEAPETSQAKILPAVESRVSEGSAEPASTTEGSTQLSSSEASSESSTTLKEPATEAASTVEPASSTTEQAAEVTSTAAPEQSTTTESASTSEVSTELSTPEASSESVSTLASEPSTPGEAVSTLADEPSTPVASTAASSEVTTEVPIPPSA